MIFRRDSIPNFLKAIWRSVYRGLFKADHVSTTHEEYDRRIAACNACPKLVRDSRQCIECTCFVDLKALLAAESCPLKRW